LYPVDGNRGFGPMNAVDYGMKDVKKYIKVLSVDRSGNA
jgi:hypothetical protein